MVILCCAIYIIIITYVIIIDMTDQRTVCRYMDNLHMCLDCDILVCMYMYFVQCSWTEFF